MSTQEHITRSSFRAALSVLFLDNLGLSVIYPIFTFLLLHPIIDILPISDSLSQRMLFLGLLIAIFPFMQFLGGPIIAHISDKKGRRYGFIFALVGEAIGFFLTGLGIIIKSYLLIIFSRLVSGFFAGNIIICLSTIIHMNREINNRSKNFRTVANISGMSFVIAIAIGGIFSNHIFSKVFNPSLPFWILTVFALIHIFIIRKSFSETYKTPFCFSEVFKNQIYEFSHIFRICTLRRLYCVFFFFMMGWITSLQFLSSFLIEHFHGTKLMSTTVFIAVGLGWYISNLWIEKLLLRIFVPSKILSISLFFVTLALFIASETRTYYLFFHCILFGSIFASLVWTNCLAFISSKSPNHLKGKILGVNQSIATLAIIMAPLFGGLLGQYDIRIIYFFSSLSLLLSLLILFTFRNKLKSI